MPTGPLPTLSPSCPFIPNPMTPWWCKVTRKTMWTLLTTFISSEGQDKSLQQDKKKKGIQKKPKSTGAVRKRRERKRRWASLKQDDPAAYQRECGVSAARSKAYRKQTKATGAVRKRMKTGPTWSSAYQHPWRWELLPANTESPDFWDWKPSCSDACQR